jgi:hypothetical protein
VIAAGRLDSAGRYDRVPRRDLKGQPVPGALQGQAPLAPRGVPGDVRGGEHGHRGGLPGHPDHLADRVAGPDYQVSPALAELFPQRRERLGEEPGPVGRHGQRRVRDEQRHHLPGTSACQRERRVVAHPQVTGEQHDCGLHHSPPRSHCE